MQKLFIWLMLAVWLLYPATMADNLHAEEMTMNDIWSILHPKEMTMNDIWNISDPTDFVYALWSHIIEKCEYGENVDALTPEERIFFITQLLEMEVGNGGFTQFFFNPSGDHSAELVDAFTAIGAVKTAAICQQALDAFGQALPADCEERRKLLVEIETDAIDEALSACDDAFYKTGEDLSRLNYDYVQQHKAAFT